MAWNSTVGTGKPLYPPEWYDRFPKSLPQIEAERDAKERVLLFALADLFWKHAPVNTPGHWWYINQLHGLGWVEPDA